MKPPPAAPRQYRWFQYLRRNQPSDDVEQFSILGGLFSVLLVGIACCAAVMVRTAAIDYLVKSFGMLPGGELLSAIVVFAGELIPVVLAIYAITNAILIPMLLSYALVSRYLVSVVVYGLTMLGVLLAVHTSMRGVRIPDVAETVALATLYYFGAGLTANLTQCFHAGTFSPLVRSDQPPPLPSVGYLIQLLFVTAVVCVPLSRAVAFREIPVVTNAFVVATSVVMSLTLYRAIVLACCKRVATRTSASHRRAAVLAVIAFVVTVPFVLLSSRPTYIAINLAASVSVVVACVCAAVMVIRLLTRLQLRLLEGFGWTICFGETDPKSKSAENRQFA